MVWSLNDCAAGFVFCVDTNVAFYMKIICLANTKDKIKIQHDLHDKTPKKVCLFDLNKEIEPLTKKKYV